ncbi:hypothetical protein L484_001473 [Morus notabilis]|uniref:Uncharacterized protein n=1 Tax=Morus notabilis TaxID=981085 RepID=W9SHU7_9ROSA|nr:hypothetical protein L484_001473 [Morus notabilis]
MGAEIDGETQVDMILETLPEMFDNFKLNYSMNKLNYSLPELIKELQTAETQLLKGKKGMERQTLLKQSLTPLAPRNRRKSATRRNRLERARTLRR